MALADNKVKIQALLAGINALPEAGSGETPAPVLQEKTVSPSTATQEVTPDGGYDGLSKVTVNAMPTAAQAVPVIDVDDGGLITATGQQQAGYVAAGTKSATKQLTTQAAQTITPGTTDQTIEAGKYLTGAQKIKGDANLVAGNIKSGVSVFGVAGSYEGSGGDSGSSMETCTVALVHNGTGFGFNIYTATCYEDGEIVVKSGVGIETNNIAIENVISGSVVTVEPFEYDSISCTNAELIASSTASLTRAFKITAAGEEIAFISFA